jgi:Mg-chelatase subunit ChlD
VITFTSPWWLSLIALTGVVLVLHMRRRRTLRVPSILLVRAQAAEGTVAQHHWSWPVPNLPMVLQLLAVVLAAIALADPRVGQPGSDHHVVVVIDASASMRSIDVQPSRFAAAVDAGERELQRVAAQRYSVLVADHAPRAVVVATADRTAARTALRGVVPTDAQVDWLRVSELLGALRTQAGGADLEVVVVTDGPGRAAAALALDSASAASARFIVHGTTPANFGFAGVRMAEVPVAGRADLALGLEGSVAFVQVTPSELTVDIVDARADVVLATIPVGGRRTAADRFSATFFLPGEAELEIRLPPDVTPFDDVARFVVGQSPSLSVLIVSEPGEVGIISPWQRALASIPGVAVRGASSLPADAATFDLVVVEGVAVATNPQTNTLWIGALPPELPDRVRMLEDPVPTQWSSTHRLSTGIDWGRLEVTAAREVPLLEGAVAVVQAADAPLVQARMTRWGAEILVAFDASSSTLFDGVAGPAFVASLVSWIDPHVGRRVAVPCQVSVPCPLPIVVLTDGHSMVDGDGVPVPVSAFDPGGRDVLPQGSDASFVPLRAGFYRLLQPEGGPWRTIAVNAFFPEESRSSGASRPSAAASDIATPRREVLDLWRWIVLVFAALVVVETIMQHRGSLPTGSHAAARRWQLGLRGGALVLVLLAFLEPPMPVMAAREGVVLVLDGAHLASDDAGLARVLADLERSIPEDGRVGQVTLRGSGDSQVFGRLHAELPERDLAQALSLASAMLHQHPRGRIVLVSPGGQPRGDATTVLAGLQSSGTRVDVVALAGLPVADVRVVHMHAPARAFAGVPFRLSATVHAGVPREATLRFHRDEALWFEQRISLPAGDSRLDIEALEQRPGVALYTLDVLVDGVTSDANDHAGVIVEVAASPRVAIVTREVGWSLLLGQALAVQGIAVEYLDRASTPDTLAGWLEYDVVILHNVPALDFHTRQQEQLQAWVRDHGGGLIMLGGDQAFGLGGYYGTPLEDLSPLSSLIPRERSDVALAFVLDRSGSMQQAVGASTRMEIAREATWEAVQLLDPTSELAIIVFDSFATVLYPLQRVDDLEPVRSALDRVAPGGGTAMHPGLVSGYEQLVRSGAGQRHIVIITDGLSQAADFDGVMAQITGAGITLSSVSVGIGSAYQRLEALAKAGGGTYYDTTDFEVLPSILAQEVLMLLSDPVVDEPFAPSRGTDAPEFLQAWPDPLPPLTGMVRTTSKPEAEIHLFGPDDLPLMGSWRYGIGKVLAYAAHGVGGWDMAWFALPEFPSLWSQTVRWVHTLRPKPGVNIGITRQGNVARIVVEAVASDGSEHVGVPLQATVLRGVDQHVDRVALVEVSPGRYEGTFDAREAGLYVVEVHDASSTYGAAGSFLYVGHDAGVGAAASDAAVLATMAEATGGVVKFYEERTAFAPIVRSVAFVRSWRPFVVSALLTFILALVARYGARFAWREWLGRGSVRPPPRRV